MNAVKTCKFCGKQLVRKMWQGKKRKMQETNKRWNKRIYCDNICRSKQLSIDGAGKGNYFYGKHLKPYNFGKRSRLPLIKRVRYLVENHIWRQMVINRDAYICRGCFSIAGKKDVHHIKPFMTIFKEFLKQYKEFSPIEDMEIMIEIAKTYEPFWDINNGIALCGKCHKLSHSKEKESLIYC